MLVLDFTTAPIEKTLVAILQKTTVMKTLFLIFNIFFASECFAQNLIQIDIQNKKVKYFIDYEKKLESKPFKSDEQHISFRDVEQPIIFERKETKIPNLLVFYTYYKKDSAIAEILYEWDNYNFDKSNNTKKPISFNKEMIKKYESIISEISKKYGKSKQEGDLKNLKLINNSAGLKRSDDWQINDSLKINSYITLSEFYKKDGPVTISPTHKIRVYVTSERNEKEPELPKLSDQKINELNKNFYEFVEKINSSDFDKSRDKLSNKIRETATNEILKSLSENISKNRKLVNFMAGYQILLDGKSYPMIQYKYTDDNNNSPKEYIVVLFEETGEIIGIKPMKLLK